MSRLSSRLPGFLRDLKRRPACWRYRPPHPRPNSSFAHGEADSFETSFATQQKPPFWRPLLFATGVSGAVYAGAAFYTNADTTQWSATLGQGSWWRYKGPSSQEMQRARKFSLHKQLTNRLKDVVENTKTWPSMIRVYYQRVWISAAELRLNSTDGRRAAAVILGLNAVVFLGWQIPLLRARMMNSWLHAPLSGRSYTMLTSTFSHQNLLHIGFNMFALISFGSAAFDWLGTQQILDSNRLPESTYTYHAYAFYVIAGIFSSFVSHLVSTRIRFPRMIAALSSNTEAASKLPSIMPSLGASGAIYATVTLSALALPHASVSLIFLPWLHVPISVGVGGMVALDVIGALRGWSVFDHWAHLGGAAFGVLYYCYGPQAWDWMRRQVNQTTTEAVS